MSENNLDDFLTPVSTGMEPTDEPGMRLKPEVERALRERLREFDLCRARALASAHGYIVR